jgi:hypothetical protein
MRLTKLLLISISVLLFSTLFSSAQYSNLNWAFGDSCGMRFNPATGVDSFYITSVKSRGTCATISDSLGNLLFYAASPNVALWQSGFPMGTIYNKNHVKMQNGDSILTSLWYKEMTIVPYPNHPNQFILFSAGVVDPGLRYSVIDLSLNSGLGKVIQKNLLLDNSQINDGFIAIQHGNGRDWWLLYRTWGTSNNEVKKVLLSPQGPTLMQSQIIGNLCYPGFYRYSINLEGNNLVAVSQTGQIDQFDFDRCTGMLSNFKSIADFPLSTLDPTKYFCDVEFSNNGRYIYVTTTDVPAYLYQMDLNNPNPFQSRIVIDTVNFPMYSASHIEKGPDGKIYRAYSWYDGINFNFPYPDTTFNIYNTHLHVINEPDSFGLACNYQRYGLNLPNCRNYLGLPNNPDYSLGKWIGSICDTLTVGLNENNNEGTPFKIYSNPFNSNVTIEPSKFLRQDYTLQVFNLNGKLVFESSYNTNTSQNIQTSNWLSGVYIFVFNVNGKRFYLKGVKM